MHTKRLPLWIAREDATPERIVELAQAYRDDYKAYFDAHAGDGDVPGDPDARIVLVEGMGLVAAGAYVVARLLPIFALSPGARDVLAAVACISMLGAALVAFAQVDLKRLLAYSTISQVGYMLAALAIAPVHGSGVALLGAVK